jgi:peroxiredoxin
MPQIDEVVSEFAAENVRLVAVNLQETSETVKAALERMGLDVTVAMDRDGSVAEQYGVTAIPQTVIIGPDGAVARLYVGVNSSFAQEMRTAIRELLESQQTAADP